MFFQSLLDEFFYQLSRFYYLRRREFRYFQGNLKLFDAKEVEVENFNKPGSAVIFPSFINHKVTKLIRGERYTLAIWWYGPKFK